MITVVAWARPAADIMIAMEMNAERQARLVSAISTSPISSDSQPVRRGTPSCHREDPDRRLPIWFDYQREGRLGNTDANWITGTPLGRPVRAISDSQTSDSERLTEGSTIASVISIQPWVLPV